MPHLLTSINKRSYLPISNNKSVKKMVVKYLLLYNTVTKALKHNDLLIFSFFIIDTYSYKSKYTNRNKNSQKMIPKRLLFYNTITKKPDIRDFLILVSFIENIYYYRSKCANTKNKDTI